MTNEFITVNQGDLIPLLSVKRIKDIADADRQSLADLGPHVNPDKFNSRIEFKDGRKGFAAETIDDFIEQGVELLKIDEGAYVPTENIIKARDLTDEDRAEFEDKTGNPLREDFKSQVETRAGLVLATVPAATVMHRMAHPEFAM